MHINKNYIKVFLNPLLIFACVYFQSCTNPETINPQQQDEAIAVDVLKKIKTLGFTDDQIKETPNYYLADGDLYFSKSKSSKITTPANKPMPRVVDKYPTLTIHIDESLASTIDEHWHSSIDQAIEEWNSNEDVNFHFAFTNSTEAHINILKDNDLPKDLAIASEFPEGGRPGSTIRINVATTKVVADTKQAFAHALEHCVGILHSTSLKNSKVKINNNTLKNARGTRHTLELYAVQGDVLYRIDGTTGDYFALKTGWAGTEVMGQIDGYLYIVQLGTLFAVNPSTGKGTPLTDGWEGSQYITSIGGNLYIMQDSWIWSVDPSTGLRGVDIGRFTLARGLVGFLDDADNKNKIGVLKRKSGSWTVSLLYTIKPSNGTILTQARIPASGVSDWNGNFLLASTYDRLNVFNGTVNFIGDDGQVTGSFGTRPSVAHVASYNGAYIYYITDAGSLYIIKQNGGYSVTRIGEQGAWRDTSCLVFLVQ
jgi:hypothetical protein